MRNLSFVVLILLVFAGSSTADITVQSTITGTGLAKMAEGDSTASIKGMKMYTEQQGRKTQLATIIDLDEGRYILLQPKKKKAEIYQVAEIAAAQKAIGADNVRVSLKATGERREILDWTCDEHSIRVEVDASNPSMPDMALTVVVTGNFCLAKEAPGAEEYAAFYTAAAEKGLFFGDPKAAEAQPGREKAMTELYRAMAEKGLPLYSEIDVGFEGSGMVAAMMSRMKVSTTTTVTSVSTDDLEDETFEIPESFKVKNK